MGKRRKVEHIRDLYRIMEKLDAAYEGPAGLGSIKSNLADGGPLPQVSQLNRYEMKIAFLSLPSIKQRGVSLTMYS